jgi:flagella synthesis protein FlgN
VIQADTSRAGFIADLRSEAGTFEDFLELLRAEQAALADRDVDALVRLAQVKSERIALLNDLARRRTGYLTAHAFAADRAGMAQWLIAHGNAEQAALSALWQRLLDAASRAQQINRENGALIETRLQHNQRLLAALTAGGQPSLYGPDGQTRIAGPGRDLGKV